MSFKLANKDWQKILDWKCGNEGFMSVSVENKREDWIEHHIYFGAFFPQQATVIK